MEKDKEKDTKCIPTQNVRPASSFFVACPVSGMQRQLVAPIIIRVCSSSIRRMSSTQAPRLKVVFGGTNFPAASQFVRAELAAINASYEVIACDDKDLPVEVQTAHVIVPFMARISADLMAQAPQLKLVIQFGVGIEGVDINAASDRGVIVSKIPSFDNGNSQSCAEHALFLAMALLRDLAGLQASIQASKLGQPLGRTLYRSRVIVYGYGGIGQALLPRLLAFGPEHVTVVRRVVDANHTSMPGVQFIDSKQFRAQQHAADVVFMCCDLNPLTMGVVDLDFLSRLSKGVILVNVARVSHCVIANVCLCSYLFQGGLLDYDAVYAALQAEHLAGLGLDVFVPEPMPLTNNPFLNHPRVLLTPHVAGVTAVSYRNMAKQMAVIIDDLLVRGIPPPGAVNLEAIAERKHG